jgi:hypothetical protein
MNATPEQVFVQALSLPVKARAALVHELLLSLEDKEISPQFETEWKQEVMGRCVGYDEGQIKDRDATDVLREAYKKLR